ncbi:glycosyltransferase family 4 protein [Candidatus Micrarchaeota archaeon]|nr:glycosyltransferase family 4 protein [Candidatus Micrarchaeota archaeon]
MSLRVCQLDPLFYPYVGGSEKVVFEYSKRLVASKKFDVTVLTSTLPNAKQRTETINGIKIVRTPSLYLSKLPSFMPPPYTLSPFFLPDLLKQKADFFHIHNRYWYTPEAVASAKLKGKLVLTLHNGKPEGISPMTDFFGQLFDFAWGYQLMRLCDRIVCVSDWVKRATVPRDCWHKATVVYNGVDVENYNPKKNREKIRKKFNAGDAPLLLSNGRLVQQKGFKFLLDAFAKLKKLPKFKQAKLVIIGKGPLKEELLKQCSRENISNSVFFVTGIPEEELPLYYAACDLFVLPTLWEPSAVVLYEALASGKPILTTDAGGNPEIVDEKSGVIVPKADSKHLLEKMIELLEDDKKRKQMGASGRKRAEKNFTWDVCAKNYAKVYESLV